METIVGKIVAIHEAKQVTEKLIKREVWVEMPGNYPQTVPIEFIQGNVDSLDNFSVDEVVEVGYTLRGRIYKDKCFVSLQGYKINAFQKVGAPKVTKKEEEDLPF